MSEQTCETCGVIGEVRYDSRKQRRCTSCWALVRSPIVDIPPQPVAPPPVPPPNTEFVAPAAPVKKKSRK